jgi:hypothetical protein
MSKTGRGHGDRIISTVLDVILEITGYDPSSLFPEYKLVADLNMSQSQIDKMVSQLAEFFAVDEDIFVFDHHDDMSLRKVVDLIRENEGGERQAA